MSRMGRNPYTAKEDKLLVEYLADHPINRHGRRIYQTLVDNEEGKWPWSSTHTPQSWREHYVKDSTRFDRAIAKLIKSRAEDTPVTRQIHAAKDTTGNEDKEEGTSHGLTRSNRNDVRHENMEEEEESDEIPSGPPPSDSYDNEVFGDDDDDDKEEDQPFSDRISPSPPQPVPRLYPDLSKLVAQKGKHVAQTKAPPPTLPMTVPEKKRKRLQTSDPEIFATPSPPNTPAVAPHKVVKPIPKVSRGPFGSHRPVYKGMSNDSKSDSEMTSNKASIIPVDVNEHVEKDRLEMVTPKRSNGKEKAPAFLPKDRSGSAAPTSTYIGSSNPDSYGQRQETKRQKTRHASEKASSEHATSHGAQSRHRSSQSWGASSSRSRSTSLHNGHRNPVFPVPSPLGPGLRRASPNVEDSLNRRSSTGDSTRRHSSSGVRPRHSIPAYLNPHRSASPASSSNASSRSIAEQDFIWEMGLQVSLQKISEKRGFTEQVVRNVWNEVGSLEVTDAVLKTMQIQAARTSEDLIHRYEADKASSSSPVVEHEPQRKADEGSTSERASTSPNRVDPDGSSPKRAKPQFRPIPLKDADYQLDYSPPSNSRAGRIANMTLQGRRDEALKRDKIRAASAFPATPTPSNRMFNTPPSPAKLSQARARSLSRHKSTSPVAWTSAQAKLFRSAGKHNIRDVQDMEQTMSKDTMRELVYDTVSAWVDE